MTILRLDEPMRFKLFEDATLKGDTIEFYTANERFDCNGGDNLEIYFKS